MAFHLISSNRVEWLKDQCADLLHSQPLTDPFTPEVILVPSMPMKRWLGLELAQALGINCQIDYPLPAAWIWQLVAGGLSVDGEAATDPLNRERAAWLIFQTLPRLLDEASDDDVFADLRRYLAGDADGVKRWQLAQRVSDLFDRYQYYRPQMIRAWSSSHAPADLSREARWQQQLWRALLARVGRDRHRNALIGRWLARLQRGDKVLLQSLPTRLSIFAVASIPQLLLEVLQALSAHCDLYLFNLTPTDQYWADLLSEKRAAKTRLEKPDAAIYYEKGHALLTAWGRQGQIFQDQLLQHPDLSALAFEAYDEQWPATMLGHLQRELFATQPLEPETPAAADDDSLALHICHSPMRECQVLHDALLAQFARDPSLKPEDVLVMIPEISRYAPYIAAVFERDAARPFIPYSLSDISVVDEQPLLHALLQLLDLPQSRFRLSELLALLDQTEIARRFQLLDGDVARLRELFEALHVRWGVDGAHRRSFGLPDDGANSWAEAEARFLLGFAMGDAQPAAGGFWQGVAPAAMEVGDAALLARFWQLFDALNSWRKRLDRPRTMQSWQQEINAMIATFFDETEEASPLQTVRDTLAEMVLLADETPLTLALLRHLLRAALAQREVPNRYFSGGVTFCGMRPMRSLPFRMICLLGMQDDAFPARETQLEFNLMAERWRAGDPVRGEMDRYLMLETLLCVREHLHISYVGRAIRDNSVCQPSLLVSELLESVRRAHGDERVAAITHEHPLQPFAAENFRQFRSYDRYWCSLSKAVVQGGAVAQVTWPQTVLPAVTLSESMTPAQLLRFGRDPLRYFVQQRLQIYLHEADAVCDDEPFALDGLARWQLKDRLLAAALSGRTAEEMARMAAEGVLPHGAQGALLLAQEQQAVAPLLVSLATYRAADLQPQLIDLDTAVGDQPLRISGQIGSFYRGRGLLHASPSKFSLKALIVCWLEHLMLSAADVWQGDEVTRLCCADRHCVLAPLPAVAAMAHLAGYLQLMQTGLCQPLPIFPKTASALLLEGNEYRAKQAWTGSYDRVGECDDPYVRLLLPTDGYQPLDDAQFHHWIDALYGAAQQAGGLCE